MKRSLQIALLALAFALPAPLLSAQSTSANLSEQYLLAAANQDRAAHNLPLLKIDDQLALAARMHAFQMAGHQTISHQFDGEQELARRAADCGAKFSLITENVAEAPSSAQIHTLWMNSAGHRANLLDPEVDSVGIAVVQQHGQLYAVEDFARSVTPLTIPQQEALIGNLLLASHLVLGDNQADARQTCTMSTGFAGSRPPRFVLRFTTSSLVRLPPQLTARLATGLYHGATVGACVTGKSTPFTSYSLAVMLYP